MMSGRRRVVCLAVVSCGGLALAIDRCVLTDGVTQPVVALGDEGGDPRVRPDVAPPGEAHALSIPEVPFPRGLSASDNRLATMRDLFAPPREVLERLARKDGTDKDDPAAGSSEGAGRPNSATFVTQNRLDGVLLYQRLEIAIVNGLWVRIGQSVEGCTLAAISGKEARFECYDGEAVLTVNNSHSMTGH